MEQTAITQTIFINANRGAQARTLEKIAIMTLGYHGFILEMLRTKQSFASSSVSLENKLNLAVQAFIDAQNTKDFAEFLDLCNVYELPIQNGALDRAGKFMQQKITEEAEKLRAQFQRSLGVISGLQAMVQKIDSRQEKSSSAVPIERPKQLFDMIYSSSPLLSQSTLSAENSFTTTQKFE
jgi:hypothetical protein